ncbi:MAG: HPr(Ser) kinase/phosphatase [Candidatus Sumerlaeia bacterium]|nr:HPr(Ser) kinase/phosphatase [Candidatus Sumerlaeia bacterium]
MADSLSVQQLVEGVRSPLDVRLVAGAQGLGNQINTSELNRPGLALCGFFEYFANRRVQVLGNTETAYLHGLPEDEARRRIETFFEYPIPCIFLTSGNTAPPVFLELAERTATPVLATDVPTSRSALRIAAFLERQLAPETHIHGVLVDVHGLGVLLLGRSGVGKSECALELVERGHRLVADDIVVVQRMGKDQLIGRSTDILRYHMEIRGLGVIDIESLYGVNSIALEREISLIVRLEKWEASKQYERLGLEERTYAIFDVEVPEYILPVEPGRNLAVLIEVAALHQRLKNHGINPARAFNESLIRRMTSPPAAG